MKYEIGDVVIKKTGGNKMIICDKKDNTYKCLWFVELEYNEDFFNGDDLITLKDFERYLKCEERDDKIDKLFK